MQTRIGKASNIPQNKNSKGKGIMANVNEIIS